MKNILFFMVLAICIAIIFYYPTEMISPGELVEGHQNLSAKCISCHQPFKGVSNNKCISCHKLDEIGEDTLHTINLVNKNEKVLFHNNLVNQDCVACHSDHKGIKPVVSLSKFEHSLNPSSVFKVA